MKVTGDTRKKRLVESRWGAIYAGVIVFTLLMIAALVVFSAYFTA